jgi:glycosyltransferase involved in cell wall biosynthesis
MPVFNGERFLAAAIESVLGQSYSNFELLINDDCSSDSSIEIASEFARIDKRVKLSRNSVNVGLFKNYNICLSQARGALVKPFAQDDLLFPEFLSKTISVLESHSDVGLVSTDRLQLDDLGRRINPPVPPRPESLRAGIPISGLELLQESLFPVVNFIGEPTCVIFRKEYAGEGFDANFFHIGDLEYWLRIALQTRYFHIDDELCGFRHHEQSCTSRNMKDILYAPDMFALGDKYSEFFERIGRTKRDFTECAVDTLSRMVYYNSPAELIEASSPEFGKDDPLGFRRIAACALTTLAERADGSFTNLRMQLRIESQERELRRYLNSASWRFTKRLRELNSRLRLPDFAERVQTPEIISLPSNSSTSSVDADSYLLYLRKLIRQVRHSKSWQLTAPIRWLEARLSPSTSSAQTGRTPAPKLPPPPGNYSEIERAAEKLHSKDVFVSVIVATWNRANLLKRALASVRVQSHVNWECIVVDDGSVDNTAEIVEDFLSDPRFKYVRRQHSGVCATRNAGLRIARGSIIAYLDSDNIWFADYLERIVTAFANAPEVQSIYTAQLVQDPHSPKTFRTRFQDWDPLQLRVDNYIDLNVFSHRRQLVDCYGPFDESLQSLVDWDLVLRYTRDGAVLSLPFIGSLYFSDADNRITKVADHRKSRQLITKSTAGGVANGTVRVLYAMWHYPQLTESYVETEIRAVRKLGVHVEVWSEEDVAVPHESEVRIHRGTLEEAITKVSPQVIHTHWLHIAKNYEPLLKANKIPATVRSHGFEMTPELVYALNSSDTIQKVFLFPHQLEQLSYRSDKLETITAAFNESLYAPSFKKKRTMVLRVGAAIRTKDYRTFMETALLCPEHEFVLVLGTAYKVEFMVEEIVEANRALGSPVKILHDIQPEEIKNIVKQSGIYMHTIGKDEPFGMSISIAEAMATGAVLVVCDRPEIRAYAGEAAFYYSSAEDAAKFIRETQIWSEAEWQAAFCRSVDRAHGQFRSLDVFKNLVSCWQELSGESRGAPVSSAALTQVQSLAPGSIPPVITSMRA